MRAGAAVLDLPWICPGTPALLALARADAAAWRCVRADPGAVLLALRAGDALGRPGEPFAPTDLLDPALLAAALPFLRDHPHAGFVDWAAGPTRGVYEAALSYAAMAARLAMRSGRCDPDYAWAGGLLAPLGWLALGAAAPDAVALCLADDAHPRQPLRVERDRWGWDQAALARRLARRWGLPDWVAAIAGDLALPDTARKSARSGPAGELFAVVQAAVALVQPRGHDAGGSCLALPVALSAQAALARLGLDDMPPTDAEPALLLPAPSGQDPADVALLPELLAQALENRRLRGECSLRRLEREVDDLHDALREARAAETDRLQAQKLEALAEFAAGAGHEINNPLAVISGQAQFLLNKLRSPRARLLLEESGQGPCGRADQDRPVSSGPPANGTPANGTPGHNAPDGQPAEGHPGLPPALESADAEIALRKIMEQAHRIHLILRELMQFARPPRPHPQTFDLREAVREAAALVAEAAAFKRVRLVTAEPDCPVLLHADPAQVRAALTCLLRNAVDASPADDCISVRVESAGDLVEILVEDNGAGPPPAHREHLFDPFFSGKSAGRGRGLGLPTAWRLARQHGGDVRFVALPDGPTRFVLSLGSLSRPVPAAAG